tara:strand:- start:1071 stop:1496 length:426 start_codon:yes stop_codon:yes gene_type:complete
MSIPLALLAPVGVAIVGGAYIAKDKAGGLVDITKEQFDDFVEKGVPIVEDLQTLLLGLGEDVETGLRFVGEKIGNIGGSIAEGTLGAVRGAGNAVLDGVQATYTYIETKVKDRRVETVAVITAMAIYGIVGFTILNKIRNS